MWEAPRTPRVQARTAQTNQAVLSSHMSQFNPVMQQRLHIGVREQAPFGGLKGCRDAGDDEHHAGNDACDRPYAAKHASCQRVDPEHAHGTQQHDAEFASCREQLGAEQSSGREHAADDSSYDEHEYGRSVEFGTSARDAPCACRNAFECARPMNP